jgi:hypothetical protein
MVQTYAVVDANHVSAPPGATWGNTGRFPGALGGHGTRRIGDFERQSAMRRSVKWRIEDGAEVVQICAGSDQPWT